MKKQFARVMFSIVICCAPANGLAAHLIKLSNGNQIVTDRYWEEGADIKFYRFGGIMGVPKEMVISITQTDKTVEKESKPASEISKKAPETEALPPADSETAIEGEPAALPEAVPAAEKAPEVKPGPDPADKEKYLKKRRQLEADAKAAIERFKELSTQKDNPEREIARQAFSDFSQQLIELQDELKKKYNGTLPPWWQ